MDALAHSDPQRQASFRAGRHRRTLRHRRDFGSQGTHGTLAHAEGGEGQNGEWQEASDVHVPSGRAPASRYFTSFIGITSARGSGPKSSPNLTGGRSWNMKSHFHRSEGFEACSQWRAATGREKLMPARAA
jgi:hypothetical protein